MLFGLLGPPVVAASMGGVDVLFCSCSCSCACRLGLPSFSSRRTTSSCGRCDVASVGGVWFSSVWVSACCIGRAGVMDLSGCAGPQRTPFGRQVFMRGIT